MEVIVIVVVKVEVIVVVKVEIIVVLEVVVKGNAVGVVKDAVLLKFSVVFDIVLVSEVVLEAFVNVDTMAVVVDELVDC